MRQYEKRRDANGERKVLDDDIKCSVMEDLVPQELATHLRMNGARLGAYDLMRAEITLFCKIRAGNKIKPRTGTSAFAGGGGSGDPMDVDSSQQGVKGAGGKGGKGKGKAGKGKGKGQNNNGKGSNVSSASGQQRSNEKSGAGTLPTVRGLPAAALGNGVSRPTPHPKRWSRLRRRRRSCCCAVAVGRLAVAGAMDAARADPAAGQLCPPRSCLHSDALCCCCLGRRC